MNSTQHFRSDTGDGSTTPGQASLFYISLGWPVLPLHTPRPIGVVCTEHIACLTDVVFECDCAEAGKVNGKCTPGKHPRSDLVPHGVQDATLDVELATRWWTLFPHANVGVDLWRSKLIDVAADSVDWRAEFMARNRFEGLASSPPLVFASGGGDGHEHWLYARGPSEGETLTNVNRKGEYDIMVRGYAVMPPSVHATGRRYRWVSGIGVRAHA